jgi:DNA polymerase-3 subunit epsilon
MNLKLKNPLAFFDLETTGISVVSDRIVEIAVVKVLPNGEQQTFHQKVNPTIQIPLESSLIHGIYDPDVADAPTFKAIAKNLANFLEGSDLAGFNIVKFDIPMLVEEFLRVGINFDCSNRKIVDAQKIFHLMEPRTLSAAYKFYCKKDLTDAHTALADTMATFHVLDTQIAHYQGVSIKDKKGNDYEPVQNDMKVLHELSISNFVDFAARMVYDEKGVAVFNFGKHKNRPVTEVFQIEPTYYDWMMKGDFALNTKQKLTELKLSMMKK